jgi:DNA adenine methylase
MIKSPLRYPGGKTKAIKFLEPAVPKFKELREPFFGGGSFSFFFSQKENIEIQASDLNYELYCFWIELKTNPKRLIDNVKKLKEYTDGKELYKFIISNRFSKNLSTEERASHFFVLNRITFSGTADSGGYSDESFRKRFTESSIDRLATAAVIMQKINIFCQDFDKLISTKGESVFIFCDPPYYSSKKSKLYGKDGIFHYDFDHIRLFNSLKETKHKFMITYDNSNYIRELYKEYNQKELSLQYGMNSFCSEKATIGKELIITNYDY